ncbi:MAG: hypothetical protein NTY48_01480 [Candidatus Diapherotrites archaeon]|nr:hypothetical protein [Candidatus Diapherotrites archaeon]
MKKDNMLKLLGIFVVVFMAGSMAAAVLYSDKDNSSSNNNNTVDTLPEPQTSEFNYTVSFDANALKELGTVKLVAFTSVLDKELIDNAVLSKGKVSKISSKFVKESLDSNDWMYLADLSFKKNSLSAVAIAEIFDINYFNSARRTDFGAAKYITITAPKYLILHNSDLNIDRNFPLENNVLSALAGLNTTTGDNLIISGKMTVNGKVIVSVELSEQRNLTQEKILNDSAAQNIDLNSIIIDSNSPVTTTDLNYQIENQSSAGVNTNSPITIS